MDTQQASISLFELQSRVKATLNDAFDSYLWVHAEISEIHTNASGHCYLELIEKDGHKTLAKLRATIWNFTYRILKPYFESSTGCELSSGLKVSFKVSLEFHEVYGLSLNIKDVDPAYTVGDIELQKQRVIRQLEADGVIHMNTELDLPLVVQNIAVISSATAAGWGDWLNQMTSNPFGYRFNYQLFEAKMQGENTTESVVKALEQIYEQEERFEAVILIRGGGSRSDLACFDTYELAVNLAQFPLPVITGIGHDRDESIADLVAHTALKTPTAVADFLISKMHAFENTIDDFANDITFYTKEQLSQENTLLLMKERDAVSVVHNIINQQNHFLEHSSQHIKQLSQYNLSSAHHKLKQASSKIKSEIKYKLSGANQNLGGFKEKLQYSVQHRLQKEHRKVMYFEKLNTAFDPMRVLERGFAMVKQDETYIKSTQDYRKDKPTEIILKDGSINV